MPDWAIFVFTSSAFACLLIIAFMVKGISPRVIIEKADSILVKIRREQILNPDPCMENKYRSELRCHFRDMRMRLLYLAQFAALFLFCCISVFISNNQFKPIQIKYFMVIILPIIIIQIAYFTFVLKEIDSKESEYIPQFIDLIE